LSLINAENHVAILWQTFSGRSWCLEARIPQYHVTAYLGVSSEFLSKLRKRLHRAGRKKKNQSVLT
jgi:hypothetical protein